LKLGLSDCARRAILGLLFLPGAAWPEEEEASARFGEEIVVVGPRRSAADPTGSVTIVEASRFAGEAKTVAELVSTAPGVAVNQYGGLGQLATVSIRGSTADQVTVLLDGLPLATAAGGGVDLSRIPRHWVERIEVVRGAEGARFGSGALGGVVNVVTRAPSGSTWAVEAGGGSFRSASLGADASLGRESWGALAALSLDGTGGRYPYDFEATPNAPGGPVTLYRDHNGSLAAGLLTKGWARLGEGRIDAALQLAAGHREIPGSAFDLTPRDEQRDGRVGAVVRYAVPLRDDVRLALEAEGRGDRLDLTSQAIGGTARQRDAAGEGTVRITWFAGRQTLAAALGGGAERLSADGLGVRARPHVALSLSDDARVVSERVLLSAALRAERLGGFGGISGKLGAAVPVAGPLSARASAGRTFRAPSFSELYLQQGLVAPNPDLDAEEAWSADAALVLDGRAGVATLGGFGTLYRNVIVYLPASFQRVKPFNAGEAAAGGLEVEAASAPFGPARLSGQVAYTLLATEQRRGGPDELGKELPHRSRHRVFARIAAAPGPVDAHLEAQYVGAQFQDLRNLALASPAALLLGAGASVRILPRPEVSLALEVKNALDDRSLTDGFLNPLPGRTVMVTARVAGGKDSRP
jgi:outer membrane cobalamin receptor